MAGSPSQMAETLSGLGRLTELRQRLLFVFAALIIYRIGTFIPVPGVNPQALLQFMNSQQGTIVDVFNLFNTSATTDEGAITSVNYGDTLSVVQPRVVRLGLRYMW